ncbi:integrase_H2C2 domain-containing protein [Trichonephila clavipes]|nr:integrase_H2C2 domain-containing protein [Trichonephila clavipes]
MWKQVTVKYWILRGRQTIRSRQKWCISSTRFNSNPPSQVIAPIPDVRVAESPPFAVVGTDFAEPLFIKDSDAEQYILLIPCEIRSFHL